MHTKEHWENVYSTKATDAVSWFQEHAKREFQFIRYADDFDRANWIIEAAADWKKENQESIPEYVIEHLSKNLFTDEADEQVATTTADAVLAAIKGGRIKLGDIELQLGKADRKAKSEGK